MKASSTRPALLTLYSRPGCHLCERMLADFRASFGEDFDIDIIDVDSEPALQDAYGVRVPVLVGRSGELCHYQLNEKTVENYLEQAST